MRFGVWNRMVLKSKPCSTMCDQSMLVGFLCHTRWRLDVNALRFFKQHWILCYTRIKRLVHSNLF